MRDTQGAEFSRFFRLLPTKVTRRQLVDPPCAHILCTRKFPARPRSLWAAGNVLRTQGPQSRTDLADHTASPRWTSARNSSGDITPGAYREIKARFDHRMERLERKSKKPLLEGLALRAQA